MSPTKLVPLVLIASLAFTAAALAGDPHFIRPSASGPDTSGSLTVTFKMVALGNTVTTVVEASANSTAVYACQSPGGSFPGNKQQEVSDSVSESGEFTSGQNGQVTGELFLNPAPSTLECPAGLTRVLASVAIDTNAQVCSDLNGCASIQGTFRRTFFDVGPS